MVCSNCSVKCESDYFSMQLYIVLLPFNMSWALVYMIHTLTRLIEQRFHTIIKEYHINIFSSIYTTGTTLSLHIATKSNQLGSFHYLDTLRKNPEMSHFLKKKFNRTAESMSTWFVIVLNTTPQPFVCNINAFFKMMHKSGRYDTLHNIKSF